MLYVTTRNAQEHYTPAYTLSVNRSKDGGFFVPFHVPEFSEKEIRIMQGASFGNCVAQVLNRLFQTQLTPWDVDFAIGRYPVRLRQLGYRIWVAETWHNVAWDVQYIVSKIGTLIDKNCDVQSAWLNTAVRSALLFGIYSELKCADLQPMDVSVASWDHFLPMNVWYARQWGLPVGNIVCSCKENDKIWNLISYSQMRTEEERNADVPSRKENVIFEHLEQLIFECGGPEEISHFLEAQRMGQVYIPSSDTVFQKIQQGLFTSPISRKRIFDTISAVFRTHACLIDPITSWAYSGLLDYRTKTGIVRPSVIISERSPVHSLEIIAKSTGLTLDEVNKILDL